MITTAESDVLSILGWQPFFQRQLSLAEWEDAMPARVVEQHRTQLTIQFHGGVMSLPVLPSMPPITVGDWLLLDQEKRFIRALERLSSFRRKAAGSRVSEQLITANVDVAFVVCSLNDDFNLNRIERYLSLIHEAQAEPVIVLTKLDLCAAAEIDADDLRQQVMSLGANLTIETVNGLDYESASVLMPWCSAGKTVVLLGSSGSGKSTLTNTLLEEERQATGAIREDDAKGRHTTTRRSLMQLPSGALILDTPGMRELQLSACEEGVVKTFSDIDVLARACRFDDCQHHNEPGCAVQSAIASNDLDPRRFENYQKLLREQAMNAATLAERRASDRDTRRYHKRVQAQSKKNKRGENG